MNVPIWAAELAAEFWRRAGAVEPFPRSLRVAIPAALELAVFPVANLTVHQIRARLERCNIECRGLGGDRRLRAALVARGGHGFAFLDACDPADEQRFSLAHELAHFLRDYWRPREQVRQRLGETALDVFDGIRPASHAERVQSLLGFAPIAFHVLLFERDADGAISDDGILSAENDADRLAYELLAPATEVSAAVGNARSSDAIEHVLVEKFGLPGLQARRYSALLLPTQRAEPWLRILGILK
ncbi:MAG TPA: ImmA/IrrE family metallo-endopeptidase [Gemmataceae bacterium]|nr:ImmA/IrrE family metallo-endopeptidase [Gemmataceae bacterium]